MSWLYVPESAALNSASELPCQERAASLSWRGKPMQPRTLSRAWKTGHCITRLSGLTLPPSTLDRGVASFIASLRAIPASQTASLGEDLEMPTNGSLSTKLSESSTSAGLIVCSARTSRGTPTDSLRHWSRHWSDWATALRQEYSARPKSAPATDATDCSSWPTASAADCTGTTGGGQVSSLRTEVSLWPTPMAGTPAQNGNSAAGNSDFSRGVMAIAESWATPQARDHFPPHSPERVAKMKAAGHGMRNLNDEAAHWPTPATRDHEGINSPEHVTTNGTGRMHMDQLPNFVEYAFQPSHPDPLTDAGRESSQTRRSLNPLFVEWLMGWPLNWTAVGGLTGLEHVGTESYPSQQPTHGRALKGDYGDDFESNCPETCPTGHPFDGMRELRFAEEPSAASPRPQQTLGRANTLPGLSHGSRNAGGDVGARADQGCAVPNLQQDLPTEARAAGKTMRSGGVPAGEWKAGSGEAMGVTYFDAWLQRMRGALSTLCTAKPEPEQGRLL